MQLPVESVAAWKAVYCSPLAATIWLVISCLCKLQLVFEMTEAHRGYFGKDIFKLRLANIMRWAVSLPHQRHCMGVYIVPNKVLNIPNNVQ